LWRLAKNNKQLSKSIKKQQYDQIEAAASAAYEKPKMVCITIEDEDPAKTEEVCMEFVNSMLVSDE